MLNFILKSVVLLSSLPIMIKLLHLYQLKDYNNQRYLKYVLFVFLSTLFTCFFYILRIFEYRICDFVVVVNFLSNIILFFALPKSKKTPLIYTQKVKRILIIQLIILILSLISIFPFIIFESILILSPMLAKEINFYDKIKNFYYVHKAQKKLKAMNVKVIAITGSNGKTSVKNILTTFLNTKYKAVCTPSSFNTPLGIAKFINNITEKVDIIVLEFGARRIGDISKLCHLFSPDYGIITMVGNQHLSTFKNYKNIYKAKAELSLYLNKKPCIYNLDNLGTNAMYNKKESEKYAVSLYENQSETCAKDIFIKNGITHFNLINKSKNYPCKTRLLGRHNITNILLAYSMAKVFNIEDILIIEKIENLNPTPHRLELMKTDIYILDDTYNCSLSSAEASMEVLSNMPNKKMIVTPGIVEGGRFEAKINENLGKMLAKFDHIVIVGKHNKQALISGLEQADCNKKILFAHTIDDAKQYFNILNKNDTLLLLNDLPDDYT